MSKNTYSLLSKPQFSLILFILFVFFPKNIIAQQADFTLESTKGCVPFTVVANDNSGADASRITYKFGDEPVQQSGTFTFNMPGIYSVTQFISGGGSVKKTNIIQVLSREPVDFQIIRCVGRRAKVNIQDFYYDAYKIDFGDNTFAQTEDNGSVEHTYSTENEYLITVRGLFDDDSENCIATERAIKPVGQLVPASINRLEGFPDGTAQIDYTLNTSLPHKLEIMTSNGFENIATLPENTTTSLVNNISTDGLYRISVKDECQSETQISSLAYLPSITAQTQNNYIDINWEQSKELATTNFVKYTILRNGEPVYQTNDISTTYFKDEAVACQVTYCYQVEIEYASGLKLVSVEKCALAQSNLPPPPVSDVYVAFSPTNQVILKWNYPNGIEADSINQLNFIRNDKEGNERKYNLEASSTEFEDKEVNINLSPYCYAISYISSCKLNSEFSGFICPILLNYEGNPIEKQGIITLNWTALQGVETSNYVLEQTDTLNKEPFSTQNISSTGIYSINIQEQEKQTIYVRVVADLADTITYSNTVRIDFRSFINFPNVFTPNGDNLNDTYGVQSRFITEFEMMIFNKWGETVFQTNDINQRWDGRYKNGFAPSGEYTLKIVATDQRKRKHIFTEMIKLMR